MTRYPKETERWWRALECCQVCWLDREIAERRPGGFQRAHIVPRSDRVCHERWNLIGYCGGCADCQHGMNRPGFPSLTVAHLLGVKYETEKETPDFWRPSEMDKLWHPGRLPWPEYLPEEYEELRRANTGGSRLFKATGP